MRPQLWAAYAAIALTLSACFVTFEDHPRRKTTKELRNDICDQFCDCLGGCNDEVREICDDGFRDQTEIAEDADCEDDYRDYLRCLDDNTECHDGEIATDECDSEFDDVNDCVGDSASAETSSVNVAITPPG